MSSRLTLSKNGSWLSLVMDSMKEVAILSMDYKCCQEKRKNSWPYIPAKKLTIFQFPSLRAYR